MFEELIGLENLFACWREFRRGKTKKLDVLQFERHLEDYIFALHSDLKSRKYRHSVYTTFHIFDPKHRVISKATVRDRLVHHAVFKELYTIFNPQFIYHSYSSRIGKGTHLAVRNLARCLRSESRHYRRNVFVLKCDIKKFFANVSHGKLLQLVENKIKDSQFLWLVREIVGSFRSTVDNREQRERERVKGSSYRQSHLADFCEYISQ